MAAVRLTDGSLPRAFGVGGLQSKARYPVHFLVALAKVWYDRNGSAFVATYSSHRLDHDHHHPPTAGN
jgi:hypothetical protein